MLGLLILSLATGLVVSASSMEYRYEAQILSGTTQVNPIYSGLKLTARVSWQEQIKKDSDVTVHVQFVDVKLQAVNDKLTQRSKDTILPDDVFSKLIDSPEAVEDFKNYLQLPFHLRLSVNRLISINLVSNDRPWSVDIKRGFANVMNFQGELIKEAYMQNIPRVFLVQEKNIRGKCQTLYSVHSIFKPQNQSLVFERVPDYENCEISKSHNFSSVLGRVCPECTSEQESPLKSTSKGRYNVHIKNEEVEIVGAVVESRHTFTPYSDRGGSISVIVNQTVALVGAWKGSEPTDTTEFSKSVQPYHEKCDQSVEISQKDQEKNPFHQKKFIVESSVRLLDIIGSAMTNQKPIEASSKAVVQLVYHLRLANRDVLREIQKQLPITIRNDEKHRLAQVAFADVLPTVGTEPTALEAIEGLKNNKYYSPMKMAIAVNALGISAPITATVVNSLIGLKNDESVPSVFSRALYLSIGIMGSRVKQSTEIRDKIIQVLKQLYDRGSWMDKLLSLKALGNSGLPQILQFIKTIMLDPKQPIELKMEAILACRNIRDNSTAQTNAVQLLLGVFLENNQSHQLRILAYQVLTKLNPSQEVLVIIANSLTRIGNPEIVSFVYNHLRTASNQTIPCFSQLTQNFTMTLRNIGQKPRMEETRNTSTFSASYYYNKLLKIGVSDEESYVKTTDAEKKSVEDLSRKISVYIFGHAVDMMQVHAHYTKNVQMKPGQIPLQKGYFSQIRYQGRYLAFLNRILVQARSGLNNPFPMLMQLMKKIGVSNCSDIISASIFGREVNFFYLTELIEIGASVLNKPVSESVEQVFVPVTVEKVFLTEAGFKLRSQIVSSTVMQKQLKYQINLQESGSVNFMFDLKPKVSVHSEGRMIVEGIRLQSAVGVRSTFMSGPSIKFTLKSSTDSSCPLQFKVTVPIPSTIQNVFYFSSTPYTSLHVRPERSLTRPEPYPVELVQVIPSSQDSIVVPVNCTVGIQYPPLQMNLQGIIVSRNYLPWVPFHPMTGKQEISVNLVRKDENIPTVDIHGSYCKGTCPRLPTAYPEKDTKASIKGIRQTCCTILIHSESAPSLGKSYILAKTRSRDVHSYLVKHITVRSAITLQPPVEKQPLQFTAGIVMFFERPVVQPRCLFEKRYQQEMIKELQNSNQLVNLMGHQSTFNQTFMAATEKLWHQWMSWAKEGESRYFSNDKFIAQFNPEYLFKDNLKNQKLHSIFIRLMRITKELQQIHQECVDPTCIHDRYPVLSELLNALKYTQGEIVSLLTRFVPSCREDRPEIMQELITTIRTVATKQLLLVRQAVEIMSLVRQQSSEATQLFLAMKSLEKDFTDKVLNELWKHVKLSQQKESNCILSKLSTWEKSIYHQAFRSEELTIHVSNMMRENVPVSTIVKEMKILNQQYAAIHTSVYSEFEMNNKLISSLLAMKLNSIVLNMMPLLWQIQKNIYTTSPSERFLEKQVIDARVTSWQLVMDSYIGRIAREELFIIEPIFHSSQVDIMRQLYQNMYRHIIAISTLKEVSRSLFNYFDYGKVVDKLGFAINKLSKVQSSLENIIQNKFKTMHVLLKLKTFFLLTQQNEAISRLKQTLWFLFYEQTPHQIQYKHFREIIEKLDINLHRLFHQSELSLNSFSHGSLFPVSEEDDTISAYESPFSQAPEFGNLFENTLIMKSENHIMAFINKTQMYGKDSNSQPCSRHRKFRFWCMGAIYFQHRQAAVLHITGKKSMEQIVWEIQQSLPGFKDPFFLQYLQEMALYGDNTESTITMHKVFQELNAFRRLQVYLVYRDVQNFPPIWVKTISNIHQYAKHIYYPQMTVTEVITSKKWNHMKMIVDIAKNNLQFDATLVTPAEVNIFTGSPIPSAVYRMGMDVPAVVNPHVQPQHPKPQ